VHYSSRAVDVSQATRGYQPWEEEENGYPVQSQLLEVVEAPSHPVAGSRGIANATVPGWGRVGRGRAVSRRVVKCKGGKRGNRQNLNPRSW
jgi:hypothetical protein